VFLIHPLFFCNNKEIQHHCKEQRKDNIRNEQNEKSLVDMQLKKEEDRQKGEKNENARRYESKNKTQKPSAPLIEDT